MAIARWLGYAAVIAAIGGAVYWNYQSTGENAAPAARQGQEAKVVVQKAMLANFVDRIESLGTLRANESVNIVSEETGLVEDVSFKEGQTVEAGKVLVKLDSREEEAEVAAAEAKLSEARAQYERLKDLAARSVATQARLDEQLVALRRAEADLRVAKARLAKRIIRAPFAGNLGIRRISPGGLVTQGLEITTLDDVSVLKLDFSVPETFIASLKVGQDIEGQVAVYPDKIFKGQVATIGSRVDPITRTIEIRALIPNPERSLRPGMLMTVNLLSGERMAVRIPEEAVFSVEDKQYVYVAENGVAHRREVMIGTRLSGALEVTGGVAAGELIVIQGLQMVHEGSPVNAVVEDAAAADAGKSRESAI